MPQISGRYAFQMFTTQVSWPPAPLPLLLPLLLLVSHLYLAAGQPELAVAGASDAAAVTHRLAKRMDLEACIGHFDVHKNTIIRTGESQAIGGKYLQGLELDTLEECERLCCETDACDVYIFERKAGGYCYLFECGPPENFHCKFTRHANYTSAVLTPQVRHGGELASTARPQLPHIPSNNISQQELELSNLKMKPEVRDKPAAASASAAATVATAAAQSAPAAHCGRFQFSCHSGECIAVYNACDGIPQCEDGSDEGPECNAISSSATKASSSNLNLNLNGNGNGYVEKPKAINVNEYQPVPPIQQQLQAAQAQQQPQQQQTIVLGPPPPPPPPPPPVNNREDAAAWANRKMIADAQQPLEQAQGEILNADELNSHIFNHKGGLQLAATNGQGQGQLASGYAATNNNNNPQTGGGGGGSVYGMSGIYMPTVQQQQMQQNLAWPQAAAAGAAQPQMQPQQQQPQLVQPQQLAQSATYTVVNGNTAQLMPLKAMKPSGPALAEQQHVLLPVLNDLPTHDKVQAADEEYEDYEEERSTEPPKKKKQRKHKKPKGKSNGQSGKDALELALEQAKQQSQPQPQPQQSPLPVPASPVHEQYKMIHDNLALEFRDHDGRSERPGGAMLSLTLGLLVTAALAILIGCRMRTVGRRARRLGGKTPYSQEADFLVNGMYL